MASYGGNSPEQRVFWDHSRFIIAKYAEYRYAGQITEGAANLRLWGGFFHWQDPTAGIGTLANILEKTKKGELWMFTESHKVSQSETNKFNSFVAGLEQNPAVKFKGIIPRDDLLKEYGRANVALDLMNWNLERELAFTTRTVEYLWAGLPVIYNNYSELSEYITRHKAGWCIDPENHDEIKETMSIS